MLIIRKTSLVVLYNAERRCWHARTVPQKYSPNFPTKNISEWKVLNPRNNFRSPCHLTQE